MQNYQAHSMLSAIVLAAGMSTRMGAANKLLLSFKEKTLITAVVENLITGGIEEIIVVTGHEAGEIQHALQNFPVKCVFNEHYQRGMTTSIQQGISKARGNGYMICLSDMPFITAEEYKLLKKVFEAQRLLDKNCICLPVYENAKGNPVIFSSFYKNEIMKHSIMEGCKAIIQANPQHLHFVTMSSSNVLKDIDSVKDYEKIT